MKLETTLHSWNVTPEEAVQLQKDLRAQLDLTWKGEEVHTAGGVDIGLTEDRARAAIVILSFPALKPLEAVTAEVPVPFPYIPGLLAFREGPVVLAAWEKLTVSPDLLMFDGQGIAHPRGIGIAAQMGLWLPCPTIGVAKSRLYGKHAEVGTHAGDYQLLYDQRDSSRVIGAALRTKERTNPLYISPGNHIDVPTAIKFVLKCAAGYRLPETTRWAHRVAGGESLPVDPPGQGRLF